MERRNFIKSVVACAPAVILPFASIPASGVSDKSLSGKIKIPLNAFSVYSDLQSECVEYKDLQSDFVRITNPAGRETAVANETNP